MRFLFAALIIFACILPAPSTADVVFDWAVVDDPGNAGDVQLQGTSGSAGYAYRASKYEDANAQYTEFLNAVAGTDNFRELT